MSHFVIAQIQMKSTIERMNESMRNRTSRIKWEATVYKYDKKKKKNSRVLYCNPFEKSQQQQKHFDIEVINNGTRWNHQ